MTKCILAPNTLRQHAAKLRDKNHEMVLLVYHHWLMRKFDQ